MFDQHGAAGEGRQQNLTLRDLVYVIFRRRFVILAVLLPIVAIASLGLFKDSGSSIAACKILIELQSPDAPRWNTRLGIDYDRTLSTMMHMAMSIPVARLAAEALEDSLPVITRLDGGAFARLAGTDERIRFLFERLDVSPVGESSILTLRFGSRNARLSLMAVEASRDAFLKYAITATKNTDALEYYDDQVRVVRDELDVLLTDRSRVVAAAGYGTIEFDLRGISQQLTDMRNVNLKDVLERSYLEAKVTTMRRARAADPDYFPSPDKSNVGTSLGNVKNHVEKLRADLQALRSKFTDDHVEVRRASERLDAAREVLRGEVDTYIHMFDLEIDALRNRERTMLAEIARLERTMADVPNLSRQVSVYDTEVVAKTQLLKDLQVKRGEVLMNTGADERIASIIRLTDPAIETIITEARKFIYFSVIAFFGLLFAVIVGIVVDSRDHRLHSPERIETQLGVPVLAAVSDEETHRARI